MDKTKHWPNRWRVHRRSRSEQKYTAYPKAEKDATECGNCLGRGGCGTSTRKAFRMQARSAPRRTLKDGVLRNLRIQDMYPDLSGSESTGKRRRRCLTFAISGRGHAGLIRTIGQHPNEEIFYYLAPSAATSRSSGRKNAASAACRAPSLSNTKAGHRLSQRHGTCFGGTAQTKARFRCIGGLFCFLLTV